MGILDTEKEQRFNSITDLMCTVFNVPIAAVSLVDSDEWIAAPPPPVDPCRRSASAGLAPPLLLLPAPRRRRPARPPLSRAQRQWFKSVQGLGDVCETSRAVSFCGHTILPAVPQLMVVKDTLEDVRFAGNPLVTGPPHIRFYAGAPLVSSVNGYRYGSLCVIDVVPRDDFPPELFNMLAQFAELTVREIEKDKMALLQRLVREQRGLSSSSSPSTSARTSGTFSEGVDATGGLSRAADCFSEGVMLVDAGTPFWRVLYVNASFSTRLGEGPRPCRAATLPSPRLAAAALHQPLVRSRRVRRRHAPRRGHGAGVLGAV
jgi:hypothetical protein